MLLVTVMLVLFKYCLMLEPLWMTQANLWPSVSFYFHFSPFKFFVYFLSFIVSFGSSGVLNNVMLLKYVIVMNVINTPVWCFFFVAGVSCCCFLPVIVLLESPHRFDVGFHWRSFRDSSIATQCWSRCERQEQEGI